VRGRFTATSIDALQEACIDGLGLTIIADWNVRDDLATGRLRLVALEDGAPEPLTIWAIHPTTRFVPPKVRLFVAALEAHLGAR
jgi:DNA-binding transcriptional LysR family regulator